MSSLKKLTKQINKCLKHPENYSEEEFHTLKKKRRQFLDVERRANIEQRGGFGQYAMKTLTSLGTRMISFKHPKMIGLLPS